MTRLRKDNADAPTVLQYVSLQHQQSGSAQGKVIAITAHSIAAEQWPYDKNPELLSSGQYGVLKGQEVEVQLMEFLRVALVENEKEEGPEGTLVYARNSRTTDWQQAQSIRPLPMSVQEKSRSPCCYASKKKGGGLVIAGDYFTHASFMGAYASASGAADAVLQHIQTST